MLLPAAIDRRQRDAVLRRLDGGISERRPLAAWAGDGVAAGRAAGRPRRRAGRAAAARGEVADGRAASYWIACHNFYVITRYNRSRLYAAAVIELAEALKAAAAALTRAATGVAQSAQRRTAPRARARPAPRVDASVPSGSGAAVGERGDDRLGERLAELDAELVERVDARRARLRRTCGARRARAAAPRRARVERAAARIVVDARLPGTDARGDRRVERRPARPVPRELGARRASGSRPASSACACASALATSSVCWRAERMRGSDRHDELDRRFARALVQPLEERVLPVGAGPAPQRGARYGRVDRRRRRGARACRCSRATSCCR